MPELTRYHCGFCDADLTGAPIPKASILKGYYPDGVTHYSQLIGVEYPYGHAERYDGVSENMCPACGVRVGRWSGKVLTNGECEPRYGVDLSVSA